MAALTLRRTLGLRWSNRHMEVGSYAQNDAWAMASSSMLNSTCMSSSKPAEEVTEDWRSGADRDRRRTRYSAYGHPPAETEAVWTAEGRGQGHKHATPVEDAGRRWPHRRVPAVTPFLHD